MDVGAQRNCAKRQRVTKIWGDVVSGGDRRSHLQTIRCENVTEFAVSVFDESNARRPIWVVLDSENFCGDSVLAARKINLAILLFVATANVTRCETAVAVATAGFFLRLNKSPLRPPLCNFIESRQRLKAQRGC